MSDKASYEQARKSITARFDFYIHLAVYVVLMAFLSLLNFLVTPGRYWVIWPLIFWGLAVAFHGVSALLVARKEALIERLTQEELSKKRFGR